MPFLAGLLFAFKLIGQAALCSYEKALSAAGGLTL
jgi:hypothetical protein